LSAALREKVRGPWHGQLRGLMTLVLRFEEAQDGSISVFLDSPDQGVYNLPASDVVLQGERLKLTVPAIAATVSGTLSADGMSGQYKQGEQTLALTLSRGEYAGHKLQLPSAVTQRLLGRWEATAGNTPLVFRFERDERGESFAFMDIPSAKLARLPVTGLRVEGDAISFVARGIGAEFKGRFADDEISGKWTTPNVQLPLTIKRDRGASTASGG
jgi:hypothetical protein